MKYLTICHILNYSIHYKFEILDGNCPLNWIFVQQTYIKIQWIRHDKTIYTIFHIHSFIGNTILIYLIKQIVLFWRFSIRAHIDGLIILLAIKRTYILAIYHFDIKSLTNIIHGMNLYLIIGLGIIKLMKKYLIQLLTWKLYFQI